MQFDFLGGEPHQFVIALEGEQHALDLIPLQW
jgi:hypothetical protein